MTNTNKPNQGNQIDYTAAIAAFVDEQVDEKMVKVGKGKDSVEFPVKRPSQYQLTVASASQYTNEIEAMTRMAQICLPDGLTEDQVFALLVKDDLNDWETPLKSTIMEFCNTSAESMAKAFEAGEAPEADADFGQPEPSTSG